MFSLSTIYCLYGIYRFSFLNGFLLGVILRATTYLLPNDYQTLLTLACIFNIYVHAFGHACIAVCFAVAAAYGLILLGTNTSRIWLRGTRRFFT